MTAILLGCALVAAGAVETPQPTYQIALRVIAVSSSAPRAEQQVRVVAEPQVITLSGRPAFFRVGETRPFTDGIVGPGAFEQTTGFQVEVVAMTRPGNRVRVETQLCSVGPNRKQRAVSDAVLSTRQRFRVSAESGHEVMWVEVVVSRLNPGGRK